MIARRVLASILIIASLFTFPASTLLAEDTPPAPEPALRSVSITIRDGADILWNGTASVPDSDTATTTIITTDGTSVDALAASALSALVSADASAPEFEITNLEYFSSFGSLYLKCITGANEKCDNWQYVVGDTYPSMGMDQFLVHDGDAIFVYFGSPRRTTLSTSTILVGESVTASAESYVPASDAYTPAVGVTLGITQTNPADPYTPLVIATSDADAAGQAMFTLSATGTYAVGIAEDYFYPSVALTVLDVPEEEPEPEEASIAEAPPQSGGGSGGGSTAPAHVEVNIPAAISFLARNQNQDGSFATALLTDWAALAFAATPEYESGETLLRLHLIETSGGLSSLTDYERHSMALLALGVNPYTDTDIDYIAKILSYFDGTQFGDPALVNDDIFAIIPLTEAGYDEGDEEIQKTVTFILSKQRPDGSWDSVDLTAAAIQALSPIRSLSGVEEAIADGLSHLRTKQRPDGGFGNSFSTSWALQAINALGSDRLRWQPAGKGPEDYLASLQASDGGIEPSSSDARTRVWASAYAIPAALGTPWHVMLREFPRPMPTAPIPGPEMSRAIADDTTPIATTPVAVEESPRTVETPAVISRAVVPPEDADAFAVSEPTPTAADGELPMPAATAPVMRQVAAAAAVETPGFLNRIAWWLRTFFTSLHSLFL